MPARSKPGETPHAIVEKNSLGAIPINLLSLQSLNLGYADRLFTFKKTHENQQFKYQSTLTLQQGKQKTKVDLSGKVFNGYSDALYRGLLPEVLIASPSAECLPDFLDDFVQYIESITNLGFFINKKMMTYRNPVVEVIPCTLLLGNGLLFSRFITGLSKELKKIQREHPSLTENICSQILMRFVRAFPHSDSSSLSPGWTHSCNLKAKLPDEAFPQALQIAGGNHLTQQRILHTLTQKGLHVTIMGESHSLIERLELKTAWTRLSTVILPSLAAQEAIESTDISQILTDVENCIQLIGKKRLALKQNEDLQSLTGNNGKRSQPAKKQTPSQQLIDWNDVAISASLGHYAREFNLTSESLLFDSLTQKLVQHCQQSAPAE